MTKLIEGDKFSLTQTKGHTVVFCGYVDGGEGSVFIYNNGTYESARNFSTDSVIDYIARGKMVKVEGDNQ
jgi:hypothetical protein